MSAYYCRLCFINCKPEELILFSKYITEMIQFCLPEVDMNLVNNPVLCPECYDKLEQIQKFKKKCLEVQDNIRQRISNKGMSEEEDSSRPIVKEEILSPNERRIEAECGSDNFSLKEIDVPSASLSVQSLRTSPIGSNGIVIHKRKNCSNSKSSKKAKLVNNTVDVKFVHNTCQTCSISFNSLNKMIHHLYSQHQNAGELYSCLTCRFKTKTLFGITNHYQNCHMNCKDLNASCFFCPSDYTNFNDLFNHMTEKHKSICKWKRYYCNSCDFRSKSYMNFRKHYFQSHDLICNYCLKSSDTVPLLNKHLRNHLIKRQ